MDDLKITGGVYNINSSADALEANNGLLINNGTITIETADDAIRANSLIQIDGGTINIENCEEDLEANKIKINGGLISLYAKNDGINAAPKVNSDVSIKVNGGTIHPSIGSGDTDAFDSNGTITQTRPGSGVKR